MPPRRRARARRSRGRRRAAHRRVAPALAAEVDERALPHELDWLRTAVHLSKGCYRGQETVAKVHNLGHPPRRLVVLQLDGSDSVLPAHGAAVRVGETPSARSRRPRSTTRTARSRSPWCGARHPSTPTLTVDTDDGPISAAQEVIVPPEAGATANVPRLPRLSRRRSRHSDSAVSAGRS